ncbi:MAG: cyclase family protein [Nitrospirae bacterium]|nr:cyclase family protein [Candidatus Manganitrophaceae bacterium]
MKLYDITLPISEDLPVWPDDPSIKLSLAFDLSKGDAANVTEIQMSVHTGTHIDAPRHFIPEGLAVDQLPLDGLIGLCRVVDLLHLKISIDRVDLEPLDLGGLTRILFKTQNSLKEGYRKQPFQSDYIALSTQAAEYLKNAGVQLIGIDAFSIEAYENIGHATHHLLLENNIIIIEGLDLKDVPAGDYELIALPIKLKDADGAPTRVVLRELSA